MGVVLHNCKTIIKRDMQKTFLRLAKQYPVITLTGPRQSGKTTLCKSCFPQYFYCNLEDLDTREYAKKDPRAFLNQAQTMILDEIQKAPSLVSYIQGLVDQNNKPGQFILTGSHQFELTHIISQSLAGRTALLKLLPFSMKELKKKEAYSSLIYRGFYPRIRDRKLNPTEALSFYVNTYIQKDLRDIKEIRNLNQFEIFLKLCASLTGQRINKAQLSNDIGVDNKTIDSWISILSASYVLFLLYPCRKNFRKRVVKQPKLYFYDVALAAYLLGIKKESHVNSHPLKGYLFENLIVIEKLKQKLNHAKEPSLYYFRDNIGNEVDLLEDLGQQVHSYEIKLAQTLNSSLFKGLNFYKKLNPENKKSFLIYTGKDKVQRYGHTCMPYLQV